MCRRRLAEQVDRLTGRLHVADHAGVVVVDGAEADGDVRLADVHDRVASSRVAIGPASDGAAGDDVRLARRRGARPRACGRSRTGRRPRRWPGGRTRATGARPTGTRSACTGRAWKRMDRSPGNRDPHRLRQLAKPGLVLLVQRVGGPSHRGVAGRLGLGGRPRRPRSGRDPSRPPRPSCPAPSARRGAAARRPPRSDAARVRPRRRRSRSHRHRCGPRRRSRPAARAGWHGCRRSPRFAWRRFSGLRPPRAIPRPGPVIRGTFGPRRRSCPTSAGAASTLTRPATVRATSRSAWAAFESSPPGYWDEVIGTPASPPARTPGSSGMRPRTSSSSSRAIFSPPPDPKMSCSWPQSGQMKPLMFSMTPSVRTLTLLNIAIALRASSRLTSCGVVTTTAPVSGISWLSESAASPVPGGRSMTR